MDATDLDDPLETCPYDKSHRILKSRMQFHLVRCRKNHPINKDQKRTCPFDAVHVVNSIEYEYHVANCPKSGSVLNFMFSSEAQRSVGSVSLEEVNNVYVPPPSENWDADPPVPTYDALKQAKNRNVLLSEIGLSKAKKRQFKNSERLRIQALEQSGVQSNRFIDTEKEDPDKPLRLPHNISKAMSMTSITGEENLNERIEELTLDCEVRLRPPRTKSVALSVCSNTDDEDQFLNATKLSNSTKRLERPVLNTNGVFNTSSTAEESTKRFQSVVTEASKKMHTARNQSIIGSSEQDNIGLQRSNKEVEDEPIDTRFLLTDLATSNSDSSINNDSDNNSCASFTNVASVQNNLQSFPNSIDFANSMTEYNMSQSDDAIIEISTRLATLSNLERDLKREKAKLKQKVDQYYASSGSSPSLTNPRCAANFSKVKEHKDL